MDKVMVAGPRHQPTSAEIGWVQWAQVPLGARARLTGLSMSETDRVALVEMASASGLSLLQENERDPWQADSRGTGQLLQNAAAQGAKAILLGLGGSATNDLGLGALGVLGLEATDENGQIVEPLAPAHWSRIRSLGGKISPTFPPLFLACDVTNPLLGPQGAAAMYGPQKGLGREDVGRMDLASHQMAKMLTQLGGQSFSLTEVPGAGAAGDATGEVTGSTTGETTSLFVAAILLLMCVCGVVLCFEVSGEKLFMWRTTHLSENGLLGVWCG
jgi:glycerate kinase